ncbi:hypothetical protein Csa_009999, partial [Cucumis sativus]
GHWDPLVASFLLHALRIRFGVMGLFLMLMFTTFDLIALQRQATASGSDSLRINKQQEK